MSDTKPRKEFAAFSADVQKAKKRAFGRGLEVTEMLGIMANDVSVGAVRLGIAKDELLALVSRLYDEAVAEQMKGLS